MLKKNVQLNENSVDLNLVEKFVWKYQRYLSRSDTKWSTSNLFDCPHLTDTPYRDLPREFRQAKSGRGKAR